MIIFLFALLNIKIIRDFYKVICLNNQLINSEIPRLVNKNNIVGNKFGTDTESILDIQTMADIAENVTLWYWDETNWLYSFAVNFMNKDIVPHVLSMSWGWSETQQCSIATCNQRKFKRVC